MGYFRGPFPEEAGQEEPLRVIAYSLSAWISHYGRTHHPLNHFLPPIPLNTSLQGRQEAGPGLA